ncbi:Phage gp6-like head-tail connector protein [Rickettsiales bacterium Ac37b]|nr:Phage gp6-like head-tail connector protein [Rickettsiales bacterium Ac37b]
MFSHLKFNIKFLSSPNILPVSLEEAKLYLRIEHNYDDNFILNLIRCTYDTAINYTKLSLFTGILQVTLPKTGIYVNLPYGPIQEIKSVKIINNNSFIELKKSDYTLQPDHNTLHIRDTYHSPSVITYQAGFGDKVLDIPPAIRQAMLMHLAALYDNRGGELSMPESVKLIYNSYKKLKI